MMICDHCGKEVQSLHGVPKRYCRKCYKHLWYLKKKESDPEYQKRLREQREFDGKREQVLQMYGYKCAHCGRNFKDDTFQLTVHHKDRKGRGSKVKNNSLDNLIPLCRSCHLREHEQELFETRKHLYPKYNGKWSLEYDCCQECGTTERPHGGKGLCATCYTRYLRKLHAENGYKPERWAKDYDGCVQCGTTEIPHRGKGLCRKCYLNEYNKTYKPKDPSTREVWAKDYDKCVVCGTTENPHQAQGKCRRCYKREKQREYRKRQQS